MRNFQRPLCGEGPLVSYWPSPLFGDDRFAILPKVGSVRNADVKSL
jgi:hypothetical protein